MASTLRGEVLSQSATPTVGVGFRNICSELYSGDQEAIGATTATVLVLELGGLSSGYCIYIPTTRRGRAACVHDTS